MWQSNRCYAPPETATSEPVRSARREAPPVHDNTLLQAYGHSLQRLVSVLTAVMTREPSTAWARALAVLGGVAKDQGGIQAARVGAE